MTATHSAVGARPGPWLSVLVPVYNVSAHVEACLHSVLRQDGIADGVELLVLDDAGTDDSWTKVQRIAASHPRHVRLLRHERNRGLSAARNSLLADARGDHVWFLDSDDVMLPGALPRLHRAVAAHRPDLVLCDFAYLRERPRIKHTLRGEAHVRGFAGRSGLVSNDRSALVAGLLDAGELHTWSKIARREVWAQAPFPEGRYFEDITVIAPLVGATERFLHVARPWIGYRQHGASILASLTPHKLRHWLASVEDLQRGLAKLDALDAKARRAVDCFVLKSLASMLRRVEKNLARQDPRLAGDLATAYARLFPRGAGSVLRDMRLRGWLLRAARVEACLQRAGLA